MYEKKLKLKHNEIPAKVNAETGEITELPFKIKQNPKNKDRIWFNNQMKFKRKFEKAWQLLDRLTTDQEYLVATKFSDLAKSYSSSLEPLNDETSLVELSKVLNLDRRKIKNILEKLFKEGVYGKFQVTDINYKVQKHWLFNPNLSFNGTHVDDKTWGLFENTQFAEKHIKDLDIDQIQFKCPKKRKSYASRS